MPDGFISGIVFIVLSENCPSVQAQRGEALARELKAQGIAVSISDTVTFSGQSMSSDEQADIQRAVTGFKQGAPTVFVNGRAKSNPSVAETLAVYRGGRPYRGGWG